MNESTPVKHLYYHRNAAPFGELHLVRADDPSMLGHPLQSQTELAAGNIIRHSWLNSEWLPAAVPPADRVRIANDTRVPFVERAT